MPIEVRIGAELKPSVSREPCDCRATGACERCAICRSDLSRDLAQALYTDSSMWRSSTSAKIDVAAERETLDQGNRQAGKGSLPPQIANSEQSGLYGQSAGAHRRGLEEAANPKHAHCSTKAAPRSRCPAASKQHMACVCRDLPRNIPGPWNRAALVRRRPRFTRRTRRRPNAGIPIDLRAT